MIAFIDDHRAAYGVEPICKVLPIAPSTYHAHAARRADPARLSTRARRDDALKPEVQRVFEENFRVYGVRKVWRQLKREGHDVARCTVARLMQTLGLQGVIRGKPVRTTISDKATPCPLDHVNRQFKAARPNALWLSDFTMSRPGRATATTMLWPRPSTVSTRPRSSIGAGRGGRSKPSSSRRWNGSSGSTIAGCWSPSAISRRPRPRSTTTPRCTNQLWRRDSNETASGKSGAVQFDETAIPMVNVRDIESGKERVTIEALRATQCFG